METPAVLASRSLPDLSLMDDPTQLVHSPIESAPPNWPNSEPFPSPTPTPPRSPSPSSWHTHSQTHEPRKFSLSDSQSSVALDSRAPFERDPTSPPPDHVRFKVHHPEAARSDYSIHSAPPELDLGKLERDEDDEAEEAEFVQSPLSSHSPTSPTPSSPGGPFGRRYASASWGSEGGLQQLPFSLWDYLVQEVSATELDGEEGVKSERVTNFLTVPGEVEKVILFGFVICLDSFLYTFTILPLRAIVAGCNLLSNTYHNLTSSPSTGQRRRQLRLSHKCDLTKALILVGALTVLHRVTDTSKMYHSVRGQETIKLYVLFNVLEVADRLCCSFGQDLQDSLFSRQTLGRRTDGTHPHIRPIALFGLNLAYVVAHTFVLFYQLVTLNVAINSYSNALLTLLLSNQFVEIKGSVFKRFEKENLFQMSCADIVERFQLALMLFIISLRNWIELSSATSASLFSFLPASFSLSLTIPQVPTLALLQIIFSPAVIVLISECFVDWLKHAFITKFNHIRPAVYGRFIDVLCKDLVVGHSPESNDRNSPFVDQSPLVSRRLGFAALPLGLLVVRVIVQALEMLADDSHVDECAPVGARGEPWESNIGGWFVLALVGAVIWACLVALKLLIGINLRAFASERWATMDAREPEDQRNDRARPHIGVSEIEQRLQRETSEILERDGFDAVGKRKVTMSTIGRYDMVKSRLW